VVATAPESAGVLRRYWAVQCQAKAMPKPPASLRPSVATNNTVKLPAALQKRVAKAMTVEGFTVWAEFCRVALTEKCHSIEDRLRDRDPVEFQRRYQEPVPARPKANGK
jgi:hypothetical protein